VNKLKIIEKVRPKIIPVRSLTNTFKVKQQTDKTSIVYTR
jgi:hypothetical protein